MGDWVSAKTFFRKHRTLSVLLFVFLFTALFAPYMANNLPLYARLNGQHCFPAFHQDGYFTAAGKKVFYVDVNWKVVQGFKIFPPVAWSPEVLDYPNAGYVSPFSKQIYLDGDEEKPLPFLKRHHLGTDKLGRDVLSGIIHGTRSSVLTGLLAMFIAGIIAVVTGSISGYFGNDGLTVSRATCIAAALAVPALYFYAFELQRFNWDGNLNVQILKTVLIIALVLLLARILVKLLKRIAFFKKKFPFPADSLITRIIELITAMPRLILILTLGALLKPSLLSLGLIIGLTSWAEMSRLLRASILSEKEKGYVEGARIMGFSSVYIIRKHILPNAITPMLVALTFGISATIMAESSLTFLGIGLPPETVSWGSLLAQSKENFQAWWLSVFPGLAIFVTVYTLNKTADAIQHMNNPMM
jgi:peptide/nickel transport system permease protein